MTKLILASQGENSFKDNERIKTIIIYIISFWTKSTTFKIGIYLYLLLFSMIFSLGAYFKYI